MGKREGESREFKSLWPRNEIVLDIPKHPRRMPVAMLFLPPCGMLGSSLEEEVFTRALKRAADQSWQGEQEGHCFL